MDGILPSVTKEFAEAISKLRKVQDLIRDLEKKGDPNAREKVMEDLQDIAENEIKQVVDGQFAKETDTSAKKRLADGNDAGPAKKPKLEEKEEFPTPMEED